MITVICTITIVVQVSGINFFGKESLKGKVLSESQTKYVVDFTKSIDSRYVGDYSKVIVEKDECVKVK